MIVIHSIVNHRHTVVIHIGGGHTPRRCDAVNISGQDNDATHHFLPYCKEVKSINTSDAQVSYTVEPEPPRAKPLQRYLHQVLQIASCSSAHRYIFKGGFGRAWIHYETERTELPQVTWMYSLQHPRVIYGRAVSEAWVPERKRQMCSIEGYDTEHSSN